MAKQREAIRTAKGIDGSFGNDCIMSWFCSLCALVQAAREVEADLPGLPEMERS